MVPQEGVQHPYCLRSSEDFVDLKKDVFVLVLCSCRSGNINRGACVSLYMNRFYNYAMKRERVKKKSGDGADNRLREAKNNTSSKDFNM